MKKALSVLVACSIIYLGILGCGSGGSDTQSQTQNEDVLVGTFSFSESSSTCGLTGFPSPIRVYFNEGSNTVTVQNTNGETIFTGTLHEDGTFDFNFVITPNEFGTQGDPDTLVCAGELTQEPFGSNRELIHGACSSNTTGSCDLVFYKL